MGYQKSAIADITFTCMQGTLVKINLKIDTIICLWAFVSCRLLITILFLIEFIVRWKEIYKQLFLGFSEFEVL